MRILLLTHAFNSLTQRLGAELQARGHQISIEFDIADSVTEEAVALFKPELIVAPYLRRAIPESIWSRHVCLVVHPGIVGDRGPSALDWALQNGETEWGVTVLQAEAEMDAGPIWATANFSLRGAKKSSIYRNEVTQAAVTAVLAAVDRFAAGEQPTPLTAWPHPRGELRPLMKQVRVPFVCVNAKRDEEKVAAGKKHAPQFEVVALPESGHFLMMEHPAAFNRTLAETLRAMMPPD